MTERTDIQAKLEELIKDYLPGLLISNQIHVTKSGAVRFILTPKIAFRPESPEKSYHAKHDSMARVVWG